ncbi:MAG TPA: hypothetical protein VK879_10515 [Candidatus Sulfomarinibacteraceae bacterium]|nr:hypothetical protein [Candidatus Sulfomarinibacteraceae bacterium]
MPDEASHNLQKAIEAIREKWGVHAIRHLKRPTDEPRVATGFDTLDRRLGGGLVRGRITEIVGAPTSGMATLALKTVAQAQSAGEMTVWLDLKETFDPEYAARCGVLLDQLILVRPPDLHQAPTLLAEFVAGDVGVLVCDLYLLELTAVATARALSSALERLLAPLGKSATVFICLVSLPPGASPAAYAQSVALPHYATVRLELQRERWIHRRQDIRGYCARVLIAKNKVGPANISVNVNILFDDSLSGLHRDMA